MLREKVNSVLKIFWDFIVRTYDETVKQNKGNGNGLTQKVKDHPKD